MLAASKLGTSRTMTEDGLMILWEGHNNISINCRKGCCEQQQGDASGMIQCMLESSEHENNINCHVNLFMRTML